jgi:hypothetical protein
MKGFGRLLPYDPLVDRRHYECTYSSSDSVTTSAPVAVSFTMPILYGIYIKGCDVQLLELCSRVKPLPAWRRLLLCLTFIYHNRL